MDLIPLPSPSVKIQVMEGKVCLRCEGKTLLDGHCQQTFEYKKFIDINQQCFALFPQVNFPTNNLNFHLSWSWWYQIQAIFLNLFYFKWKINLPKRFKKSVSPWTSTNNYSFWGQSSARIQKYFCPIAKRHNFFYQTVIDDCSSRILKQGPNSFEGLTSGWLTLQSRTFQP